jgi:hypothetical protein
LTNFSTPSRLKAVGETKKIGVVFLRKKVRICERPRILGFLSLLYPLLQSMGATAGVA